MIHYPTYHTQDSTPSGATASSEATTQASSEATLRSTALTRGRFVTSRRWPAMELGLSSQLLADSPTNGFRFG